METKLFNHFENLGKLEGLHPMVIAKFRICCKKAVDENPDLGFGELIIACRIYLNFLIEFPDLQL